MPKLNQMHVQYKTFQAKEYLSISHHFSNLPVISKAEADAPPAHSVATRAREVLPQCHFATVNILIGALETQGP